MLAADAELKPRYKPLTTVKNSESTSAIIYWKSQCVTNAQHVSLVEVFPSIQRAFRSDPRNLKQTRKSRLLCFVVTSREKSQLLWIFEPSFLCVCSVHRLQALHRV